MAFRRLRKVAQRIRKAGGGPAATGFGTAQTTAFAKVETDGEAAFQFVGSALVSTWEVGITEIGRALVGKLPEAQRRELVERVSDSLVPLQQPLQQAGHSVGAAVKQGVQAGRLANELGPATGPLVALIEPLSQSVEEGWAKATDYLAPVFEVLPNAEQAQASFAEGGAVLGAAFATASATYASDLGALSNSRDLEGDLSQAMQDWQRAVCRAIEINVFERLGYIFHAARDMLPENVH